MSFRFRVLTILLLALPAMAQKKENAIQPKPAAAQAGLTVDGVVAMVDGGLSDDVIIAKLRKDNKSFDLSSDDLTRLKNARVSANVMRVTLDPKADVSTPPAQIAPPQLTTDIFEFGLPVE